jgi:hypothetical protein
MNQDDIIRMAREAGAYRLFGDPNAPEALTGVAIERFAAIVAVAEREACAKVVEQTSWSNWFQSEAAAAIRARGQA